MLLQVLYSFLYMESAVFIPDTLTQIFQKTEQWSLRLDSNFSRANETFFFHSAVHIRAKFDFVVSRLNSSITVTPVQSYLDGDNLQGHEQALWILFLHFV